MPLPLNKKYQPMEAQPAHELPIGREWQYEPKWDGFRRLAFGDHNWIDLMSKSAKPLTRYFPELVAALLGLKAQQFVLDGEIVIPINGKLSFDDVLLRVHPASSRIRRRSRSMPCLYRVFDLLVDETGKSLVNLPLEKRLKELEAFARKFLKSNPMLHSPATSDPTMAHRWFNAGVGLDGVIAKRRDLPYESEGTGMQKIKTQRTADCVVGGLRYLEKQPPVGSLLLGLYNEEGKLDHVGFTSSIPASERAALTRKLKKLIKSPGFTGHVPAGSSHRSTRPSSEWAPLKSELVSEVQFDHFSGWRFRHGSKFLRWRPDKFPRHCTIKQGER